MASSRTRKCKNKADLFCYICGIYTLTRQRSNISLFLKRAHKAYIQVPLGDQEKKWAPHIVRHNCEGMLRDWTKESERAYLLVYLWCGVNRKNISLTAIFVW